MSRHDTAPTVANLRRAIWFKLKEQSFEPAPLDALPGWLVGFMGFQHTPAQVLAQYDEAVIGTPGDRPRHWVLSDWSGERVLDEAALGALAPTAAVIEWDGAVGGFKLRSGAHRRGEVYVVAVVDTDRA